MFATFVVWWLIAGSLRVGSMAGQVRAQVLRMRGRCGLDMQCAGCGVGFLDSSRVGTGYPHWVAGQGRAGNYPTQTSSTANGVLSQIEPTKL